MAKKYINWKTKGMNRDMSVSAFNPEFAFENVKLRLVTNEGNTMMSWVNERGTKKMTLHVATGLWEENFGNKKYIDYITGIRGHGTFRQYLPRFHHDQYRWVLHQADKYRILPLALHRLCNICFHVPLGSQLHAIIADVQWENKEVYP